MQVITYSYMGLVHADSGPRFPSIRQAHLPDCECDACAPNPNPNPNPNQASAQLPGRRVRRVRAVARRGARQGVARLSGLVRGPVQDGAGPTSGVVGEPTP